MLNLCHESSFSVGVNPLRKTVMRSPWGNRIAQILLSRANPKIVEAIISWIAILVINILALIQVDAHQNHDDSMGQKSSMSVDSNVDPILEAGTGTLASKNRIDPKCGLAIREMMIGALLPRQNASQRIVIQALLQKLPGRQWLDGTRWTDNSALSLNAHVMVGLRLAGREGYNRHDPRPCKQERA